MSRTLQLAIWVDDDTNWIVALGLAHGQPWIIGGDGPGADDDGVDERPQPVQPSDIGLAGDIVRMACFGRYATIEALGNLADRQRGARLDWQINVEDIARSFTGGG